MNNQFIQKVQKLINKIIIFSGFHNPQILFIFQKIIIFSSVSHHPSFKSQLKGKKKQKSTDAEVIHKVELSDKDFKETIIKILQLAIMITCGTNEKIGAQQIKTVKKNKQCRIEIQ